MTDIQTRPFSKNYSGLSNQSVIAIGLTILCVSGQEFMKRRRRGKGKKLPPSELGSKETWEFGYLYQGRSWAWKPSPPSPQGWILSWVPQIAMFPEDKMNELRGVDATLYIRFLRGCFYFTLLHTMTTFPILFPIHVEFSEESIDKKSMTRASISSLVTTDHGKSLLWIHICLLFWITITWIMNLFWISNGAFMLRAARIKQGRQQGETTDAEYHPHPHPPYAFASTPTVQDLRPSAGLRLRTIMVSNVPPLLRSEKELKEYFEYFMSRKLERPAIGLTANTQPGFFNKSIAFIINWAKRLPAIHPAQDDKSSSIPNPDAVPIIERVVIARKMTELASLLERREDILRLLETAHVKLAKKTLDAVKKAMEQKEACKPFACTPTRAKFVAQQRKPMLDTEVGDPSQEGTLTDEQRMEHLIKVLGPFIDEFELRPPEKNHRILTSTKHVLKKVRAEGSPTNEREDAELSPRYPPAYNGRKGRHETVWDALLSVPRSSLDAYQPLINLSHLFRGKTVPSIDYYTAKLNLLTSLITEGRAKHVSEYDPVSTAFVTFADSADAMRACKYLAVHPHNPLTCLVQMAPEYQDLDWIRVMKSSHDAEFVKDWVVGIGVWAFTVFWLFPVSLLVGLVSIQNISAFWPGLKQYLDRHSWEEEVIQSFLPTILVALLALLIPLILLLIAKKAHTITTLSAMHDRIMTRYYKFLVVNVLVFFCVGTAALQSILDFFRSSSTNSIDLLEIVASSFPSAGPFYVGWQIFTTAMQGGFEIALLGLPLIMYPATSRQVTPRKRAVGVRPRTFNYYYWLPTHLLLVHVLVLFAVLNPFVLPFGTLYFFTQIGVIKNQLIHIYAKNYEGNGKLILIRLTRYSLDGLILAQAVFLAYMVVLKKTVNVGLAAVLIILTSVFKIVITRMLRVQFEADDILEANTILGTCAPEDMAPFERGSTEYTEADVSRLISKVKTGKLTWRIPAWVTFSYGNIRHRHPTARPNPFRPCPAAFSGAGSYSPPSSLQTPNSEQPSGSPGGPPLDLFINPEVNDADNFSGPVVPHPPPVPWDDLMTPDLPYDNPYYVRPISNVLWLPRNPCGILDLDDTVDMKTSITVEPSTGKLGTWMGMLEVDSPMQMSQVSLALPIDGRPKRPSTSGSFAISDFDGTEDIDLPLIIAKRLAAGGEEIENSASMRTRRPSTFRGRPSTSSSRRPGPFLKSYRSFSDTPTAMRKRANSVMTVLDTQVPGRTSPSPSRRPTSPPIGPPPPPSSPPPSFSPRPSSSLRPTSPQRQTLLARPDALQRPGSSQSHPEGLAHAEFGMNASSSKLTLAIHPVKRAENISAHQAILREVMAEEQEAFVDRLETEEAEASKTTKSRSFLTSWMYKKPADEDVRTRQRRKEEGG